MGVDGTEDLTIYDIDIYFTALDVPPSLDLSNTPKGCEIETFWVVLGCKRILDPTVSMKKKGLFLINATVYR